MLNPWRKPPDFSRNRWSTVLLLVLLVILVAWYFGLLGPRDTMMQSPIYPQ